MFYMGRRISGEEATRTGLANICVPQDQVRIEVKKLATEIAECAPLAIISTRKTMRSDLADRVASAQPVSNRNRRGCARPKNLRKGSKRHPNVASQIAKAAEKRFADGLHGAKQNL
jgi:enoyl-CoA hydratase/carnithine racemase